MGAITCGRSTISQELRRAYHIDWIRNRIRLYGKKKEKFVPMHPKLRKLLPDRKADLGIQFDTKDHIIGFVCYTPTKLLHG